MKDPPHAAAAAPFSWRDLMAKVRANLNSATPPSPNLTERVKGRVAEAGAALEQTPGPERESRSLRRVYGEMKTTYQQYRRQTGRPAVPGLRDAVHAFKRGPSLPALVAVAAYLDERGLLCLITA